MKNKLKKELPVVILFYIFGMAFVFLTCWNAEKYDKAHPVQKVSSYYEYEVAHK